MAEKRAIARAAARLIAAGDGLITTGGTTACALVEFLPPENLDIMTNAFPVVTQVLVARIRFLPLKRSRGIGSGQIRLRFFVGS
jgi:DeoR/GlpR family transcriptional regulator of sugar metabolism